MNIANFCYVHDIEKGFDKDLYDFLNEKQKIYLQDILKESVNPEEIPLYMSQYLSDLLMTRLETRLPRSLHNEYLCDLEEDKIVILWNLYTPQRVRLEFEYKL